MGRKKSLGITGLLLAFLIVPFALGARLINVAELPLFSGMVTSSSSPKVFVNPANILNETLQAGSNFTVRVDVSSVSDLFTWQVNMTWNSSILNVSRIILGEFLARAVNQTSSEALGVVINSTDNARGRSAFAESILGDVGGISGNGTLVSVEFIVLKYGWSNLAISVSGTLPTKLLNSAGSSITFTVADGYFRNKIPGDIDGDRDVDPFDFSAFRLAYGSKGPPQVPVPDSNYKREADFDVDGDIDPFDFSTFRLNYGRKV